MRRDYELSSNTNSVTWYPLSKSFRRINDTLKIKQDLLPRLQTLDPDFGRFQQLN